MVHKEFMNKRELRAYEAMESQVSELNSEYRVGETVQVRTDFGKLETDVISSPFSIMSGQVVAWLENRRCYMADRVEKIL